MESELNLHFGLYPIDTHLETGERVISVELSGPEYSARDAYERHGGGRPPTMGTFGVSMSEMNLRVTPDLLPDNPHHWLSPSPASRTLC